MNLIQNIIALLAGCGVFIVGMSMLSDGLEKSAGSGLKKLLGKISNNRFAGIGVGASITALIQSSSATSVMVIGFVNAGIMSLTQATAIIMGANIGTTVTGLIVSLSALDVSLYATLLSFVGIMMTFTKNQKIKNLGTIICGFGLLFVGLELMGDAFNNDQIKNLFSSIFASINFPLLLIICGVLFTALIQSSSAATGLIIVMVGSKAISVESALFVILGSNIGTCITAILASIGATTNAKRTAFIHFLFNFIGTIVFTIILWLFSDSIVSLLNKLFGNPQMQIAWFHVIFNVTTTLLLVGFINQLVKLSNIIIKDIEADEEKYQLKYIDNLFLVTPSVALMQVKKEIEYMASIAKENLNRAFLELKFQSGDNVKSINKTEELIDFTNNQLTKYLIKLSSLVDYKEEKIIGSYFHVINDIERIGDHAINLLDMSIKMRGEDLIFSSKALEELDDMYQKLSQMYDIALDVFDNSHIDLLKEINVIEEQIDQLKNVLSDQHFIRLTKGDCKMELSTYFHSTVSGLERVADHLVNIGYSIINPTGSQSEN